VGQAGTTPQPGDMGKAGAEAARPGGAGQQGAAPPPGDTAKPGAGGAATQRDKPPPAAPAR
jgi:hypothetical protein